MVPRSATDLDRQAPPLCDEQGPIPEFPPLALDPATGRPLPIPAEERAARRADRGQHPNQHDGDEELEKRRAHAIRLHGREYAPVIGAEEWEFG